MNGAVWIIVFACIVGCLLFSAFVLSLVKAAAPQNAAERARDDFEQMKALGYFDNIVTSGSAVVHK